VVEEKEKVLLKEEAPQKDLGQKEAVTLVQGKLSGAWAYLK